MTLGLLGTKIGMTREFLSNGLSVPVTVIKVKKERFWDVITKETEGNESLVAIKIYRSSGKADIEIYSLNNDQMDKLWKEVDIYLEAKDFLDSIDLSVKGNNFVTYAVFLALREIFKPQTTANFMCEKSTIKF